MLPNKETALLLIERLWTATKVVCLHATRNNCHAIRFKVDKPDCCFSAWVYGRGCSPALSNTRHSPLPVYRSLANSIPSLLLCNPVAVFVVTDRQAPGSILFQRLRAR